MPLIFQQLLSVLKEAFFIFIQPWLDLPPASFVDRFHQFGNILKYFAYIFFLYFSVELISNKFIGLKEFIVYYYDFQNLHTACECPILIL